MNTKIQKPWGFEIKLTEEDLPYTSKILYLIASKRLSLQYHDQKTETLTLLSGKATITTGSNQDTLTTMDMVPSHGYTIIPGTVHRISALTDCVLIEASTPEMGTTYRIEDDYARPDETEALRTQPNRGWSTN